MPSSTILLAPCETCLKKNGLECLKVAAMLRMVHVIETEIYSHGLIKQISNISIQCKDYISDGQILSE